ncbi:MAG: hypothetical protein JSV12_05655 [Candidatus Bathyarchaeota archaeon]|nr:MAG: hypothetical protein JSV12_05655 [Candidatus Bathyarchaeota archaeon]
MTKERDDAIFWAVIGIIILVSAFIWLGKESGWWEFEFPFWPVMFVWIGIAVTIEAVRKLRKTS